MILINRTENDPFYNIAAEEYMLKNVDEDVFMLWINSPSVIIGKHQVAAAEADIMYTYRNNIPVIRRISGGGTVYHDEGNLNYSLITTGKEGSLVDYEKYAGTVIRALGTLGIDAYLKNKSSLFTGGKKFSGNAEHVYRNRVLHHGTLLFNTDIDQLRNCIRPSHEGYNDNSVRSVDSKTVNLGSLLPKAFTLDKLREIIVEQVHRDFPGVREYIFNSSDRERIVELASSKYSSDEWNFGYSPRYALKRSLVLDGIKMNIELSTEKGIIHEINIKSDGEAVFSELSEMLPGVLHHPGSVMKAMTDNNLSGSEDLIAGIF
jgi:lipoate-protein ligase A